MELRSFITVDEAIRKGRTYCPKIVHKKFPLIEGVGRYSMQEVISPSDFPKTDRSAMDGYAISSKDSISSSRSNPSVFSIVGELYPSSKSSISVKKGQAVKVMTGATIPGGTDSVVMFEETQAEGKILKVFSPVRKFQNISRRGEDMKKGLRILKKGQLITPPHVAALSECGKKSVSICSLSIGILSTGDELISRQVINSTQPLLKAYFDRKGFYAKEYGSVEDDEEKIERRLTEINEDVIIVTGGTGPGDRDFLPYIIEENGKFVFRGLRIRPGRTTSFGWFNGKPIFMISGLPVAALIASENVILRMIESWFNLIPERKEYVEGVLQRSVVNTLGFRSFVRVKVIEEHGSRKVVPTRTTGSGVIYSVIDADGILTIDENSEGLEEGQTVRVEMLRW
ncbi:MAG: molybdopterin molybdotransferase MoeA [Candidatus Thermoplasmatota archaeon]|nr:molybdopterin molybdotransferase MoeA [Candidatus Thermoplasmatota archaeon]MCL6002747.1 molybdopterin molybdotransferase MoeA [Candidatus Thermoplasmatota archaeon]